MMFVTASFVLIALLLFCRALARSGRADSLDDETAG
jgi:hypothetical protein